MKNIYFFSCLFLSSITLHSMELDTLNNESNEDVKTIIKNDFKNYLGNRLKEYNKKAFSYEDMQDIEDMYVKVTNKQNESFLSKCLHRDVCDAQGNTFVHHAVKNRDLKMVEWLMRSMRHPLSTSNNDGKEPLDLCIEQLMPHAEEDKKEDTYKIFNILTAGYNKINFDANHRRNFLKKIVALEFEHIKHDTNFTLKEDALKYFSGQDIILSEIYQEVCDEKGNTFTHMLVSHHLSDMLYKFIEKNYISCAQNQHKQDSLTFAQRIFIEVARNLLSACAPNKNFNMTLVSEGDMRKKCCYFMLLNLQKKHNNNTDFKQCCDKHII